MPIISDRVAEKKPRSELGGGGPGKTPHGRGYGGDDEGDRDQPADFFPLAARLVRYRVGVALFSVCVTLLFLGIASAYVVRQGMGPYDPERHHSYSNWRPLTLPYFQLWTNSLLLLLSSVTAELARRGMRKKVEFTAMGIRAPKLRSEAPWLGITVLLGLGFLAGQLVVWNGLRHQGVYMGTGASGAFFYTLTGLHAVHLAGGLAVLFYALLGDRFKRPFESQQIAVDATAWYWHFMAVLWFCIFALLHFSRS